MKRGTDAPGGGQKEFTSLGVVGEGVAFEGDRQTATLTYKTQRSPQQIKPLLPTSVPRTVDASHDAIGGRAPAFVQIQPSNGLYYNSISPTRQQKYLIQQHQIQRGPVPQGCEPVSQPQPPTNFGQRMQQHLRDAQHVEGEHAVNEGVALAERFVKPADANVVPFASSIIEHGKENGGPGKLALSQQYSSERGGGLPKQGSAFGVDSVINSPQPATYGVGGLQQEIQKENRPFGRTHKAYDYMFIQMSNEQFVREYATKRLIVVSRDEDDEPHARRQSPRGHDGQPTAVAKRGHGKEAGALDLGGLVKIRAYEATMTDELPTVQCNLQPTQFDHLKVLVCEQEDKGHPKLTPAAQNRFEVEKQTQIRQYMEDIIGKL